MSGYLAASGYLGADITNIGVAYHGGQLKAPATGGTAPARGFVSTTAPTPVIGQRKISPYKLIAIATIAVPVVGLMKYGMKGLLIGSIAPVGLFLWAVQGYSK
jgi:hypothetical protein